MTSDWRHPNKDIDKIGKAQNVGLVSSVGRALARESGGRRFKSRSSKFLFVYPKLKKYNSEVNMNTELCIMFFGWTIHRQTSNLLLCLLLVYFNEKHGGITFTFTKLTQKYIFKIYCRK